MKELNISLNTEVVNSEVENQEAEVAEVVEAEGSKLKVMFSHRLIVDHVVVEVEVATKKDLP
jgi:hypothetical protein